MNNPYSSIIRCVVFCSFIIHFNISAHAAGLISLPRTGQSVSYVSSDDGSIQDGVIWGSARFADNGNGTISDSMTGLVWLKNANCFVASTWNTALTLATNLSSSQCGLTDGSQSGNWRLPNQNELRSLIDYSTFSPALSTAHPFQYVQNTTYWTSTSPFPMSSKAWAISLYSGDTNLYGMSTQMPVWPVRGGIDMVSPLVTVFSLPISTTTLAVPTTISATDNVSVIAYCLTETNNATTCTWNPQKPDTFTFGGKGNKTLYVFARDTDGNISESKSADVNILYLLTVSVLGTGNGSVHSSPMPDISCIKGTSDGCAGGFSTDVTLTASPQNTTSLFDGWSYACTTSQHDCVVSMNDDKTAVATFSLAPRSKLDVAATTGYDTLQAAYGDAVSTIFALDGLFSGEWKLDKGKDITLAGGYLAEYGPTRNGFTILSGKLSILNGSLKADRLVVRDPTPTTP